MRHFYVFENICNHMYVVYFLPVPQLVVRSDSVSNYCTYLFCPSVSFVLTIPPLYHFLPRPIESYCQRLLWFYSIIFIYISCTFIVHHNNVINIRSLRTGVLSIWYWIRILHYACTFTVKDKNFIVRYQSCACLAVMKMPPKEKFSDIGKLSMNNQFSFATLPGVEETKCSRTYKNVTFQAGEVKRE